MRILNNGDAPYRVFSSFDHHEKNQQQTDYNPAHASPKEAASTSIPEGLEACANIEARAMRERI